MSQEKWCWSPYDPEMTYPDAREMLEEQWPNPELGVHQVDWAIRAPSTWAVVYYDEEGFKTTKEFDSVHEAEAFAKTARMTLLEDEDDE